MSIPAPPLAVAVIAPEKRMHRYRVIRFMASGLAAFLAQAVVLMLLVRLTVPEPVANLAAIVAGMQASYVLSALITWRDRKPSDKWQRAVRWASFTLTLSLTSLINDGIFLLARHALPLYVAAALGSSCTAILNYFCGDRLVFRAAATAPSPVTAIAPSPQGAE